MLIIRIQGGLGNQMFQYAIYKSLMANGKKVYIDKTYFNYSRSHNGFELENIFKIRPKYASEKQIYKLTGFYPFNFKNILFNKLYKVLSLGTLKNNVYFKRQKEKNILIEKDHSFIENIFDFNEKYLDGYWQNIKYFSDIEKEILSDFTFQLKNIGSENEDILKLINNTNSVCVHVRRGDYINNKSLGINLLPYYKSAINHLTNNTNSPTFFVFSDDIKYCKEELDIPEAKYIDWNQNERSYLDMYLMSQCKHNIIANSTFSWWGAFLNKNQDKIVIAPKSWFNDKSTEINNIKSWTLL